MRTVVCVNLSTDPFPDWAAFLAAAQQYADLAAAAGYPACRLVTAAALPPPGAECLVVWDDTDQAAALAYHDEEHGAPLGHTFRRTAAEAGIPFGVPFTHELVEQLADPACNLVAISGKGNLVAYEVADAVEDPQFALTVAGYACSDFVLPTYWDPNGRGPYDHGGHVVEPFEVLPGGYLSVLNPAAGEWTTLQGSMADQVRWHAGMHCYRRAARRHGRPPRQTFGA